MPDALIHTLSFGIALFTISLLHIVLGEQIPKLVAIRHPMRVSYLVAQPLRGLQFIGFPFIWLFDSLTQIVMRMLKIEGN